MRYRLALAALFLSAAVARAGDNWPQFRGPTGDGISDATALPTKWDESENVRWKTAIHGKAWSSPVVWGNQVWMTTATEDGKELSVVCVDRASGKIVHDFKVFDVAKPQFCIPYNSYASPTPVVEEGRLYAHFGSPGTACIDTKTGKVLWEQRDLECNHYRGAGSSPVLYGGLLFLTFDGFDHQFVAALDKKTGKVAWKKDRSIKYSTDNGDLRKAYSTPAVFEVNGKPQLVSPAAEATVAYDPATGDELWSVTHGGMNEACRPLRGHGLIYLTSGHLSDLLAVKEGGSGDLTRDGIVWKKAKQVPTRPSLLLIGDYLYMVSDAGIASCLEAKTGKQVWQERINGKFSASPVFAGGHIYFCDESDKDGKTYVIDAAPTFKVVSVNKLDVGCMASPAVAGNELFLRTKTHLYCIAAK